MTQVSMVLAHQRWIHSNIPLGNQPNVDNMSRYSNILLCMLHTISHVNNKSQVDMESFHRYLLGNDNNAHTNNLLDLSNHLDNNIMPGNLQV